MEENFQIMRRHNDGEHSFLEYIFSGRPSIDDGENI